MARRRGFDPLARLRDARREIERILLRRDDGDRDRPTRRPPKPRRTRRSRRNR
jgi:hypothetical protein